MIDDDLDKLLSEVESEEDYSRIRDGTLSIKQKIARKSDSHIEEKVEGLSADEVFMLKVSRYSVDEDVLVFKNGCVNSIKHHEILTNKFKRLLVEKDTKDEVYNVVQKNKYTFIRFIENIIKLFDEYSITLVPDVLSKKAKKEFNNYFQGFEEENKVEYLVLKELFLRLREFNSRVKKEWGELSRSISVINLVNDGKTMYQELKAVVDEGNRLCETTEKFLRRIAMIISLPEEDFDVLERNINNKMIYHESFHYTYDSLFDFKYKSGKFHNGENLKGEGVEVLTEPGDDGEQMVSPVQQDVKTSNEYQLKTMPDENITQKQRSPDSFGIPGSFTIRGTAAWNTREPYVMRINEERYRKEMEDFQTSFFFAGFEEKGTAVEGAVKRAMIRYLSDTSSTIKDRYEEFVFKTIIALTQRQLDFFGLKDNNGSLFLYHLGPATIYRQILMIFQNEKYGMCFKYLPGNKVLKYIPGEFIKEKILYWYEENINSLDLEFDKVQFYDDVRRIIADKYKQEMERNLKQLDDLVKKLKLDQNKNFNRDEYFMSKWNEWFGTAQIIVYNRFIERSIFK